VAVAMPLLQSNPLKHAVYITIVFCHAAPSLYVCGQCSLDAFPRHCPVDAGLAMVLPYMQFKTHCI